MIFSGYGMTDETEYWFGLICWHFYYHNLSFENLNTKYSRPEWCDLQSERNPSRKRPTKRPPNILPTKKFKSLKITTYKSVYSNKDKIGF